MCDVPRGKQTVTDQEILAALQAVEGPAATAGEVAADLELSVNGVRMRLDDLAADGRVNRKKTGHRTVLWWPA